MKIGKVFVMAALLGISESFVYGQNASAALGHELTQLYEARQFSGAVLLAHGDKIDLEQYLGFEDAAGKRKITSETRFELASISKTFTAVLVLQLVERGKLKLDDKYTKYMGRSQRAELNAITLHQLLSHTSGIQDFVGLNAPFAHWTEKDFMEGLEKTPVNFEPGSKFEYASSTYILLRYIIEHVTGQDYESNLKQHILIPAGMTQTGVVHNDDNVVNLAHGLVEEANEFRPALPIANHEIFLGASSLYSTARDLVNFDHALYGDKILGATSREKMYSVVLPPYGYGWFIDDDADRGKVVSHGGDIFGYTTLLERRLKQKTVVIILGNLQNIDRRKIVALMDSSTPLCVSLPRTLTAR